MGDSSNKTVDLRLTSDVKKSTSDINNGCTGNRLKLVDFTLCEMPGATKLGPKDTHSCYTCKKRMHGGIFCELFENEDDYSGKIYCKKCGRPGNDGVSRGVTCYPSSDTNCFSRPEKLDNYYYSNNPNH